MRIKRIEFRNGSKEWKHIQFQSGAARRRLDLVFSLIKNSKPFTNNLFAIMFDL